MDTNILEYDTHQGVTNIYKLRLSNKTSMICSSKENKYVPSEQKILIDALGKYQARLEQVDNFDHIIMPPLYQQVVRYSSH